MMQMVGPPGRGHAGHLDQGAGHPEAGSGREGAVRARQRRGGEAAAARWQEAVGHGLVLHLPEGAEDVNDLAQQPNGEAVFHRLVEGLLS